MKTIKFKTKLHTCGDGLWSNIATRVNITNLSLSQSHVCGDEEIFPASKCNSNCLFEFCVGFDNWDVSELGLIYTDSKFIAELRKALRLKGFSNYSTTNEQLCYSEQGMQGDDYVSFRVSDAFVSNWKKVFENKNKKKSNKKKK